MNWSAIEKIAGPVQLSTVAGPGGVTTTFCFWPLVVGQKAGQFLASGHVMAARGGMIGMSRLVGTFPTKAAAMAAVNAAMTTNS